MLRVLLDANVFVSSWTLDVLMCLADEHLLEPVWSDVIVSESTRALVGMGRRGQAEGLVQALRNSYPISWIEGQKLPIKGIELPDPDDRHVVAAALVGECDCIVTYNLRDFPQEALAKYGLRVGLIRSKRRPPRTYDQEMEGLRRCGMCRLADWLDS